MFIILRLNFLQYELEFLKINHVHYTSFICDKKMLDLFFINFEK
jgi:hypothetical protein